MAPKANDRMEVDSDSDISIDLEHTTAKGKGKAKPKAGDKRKQDKGKGKAKDTVRRYIYSYVAFEVNVQNVRLSKHTPGRHRLRVLGKPCKRMKREVCRHQ